MADLFSGVVVEEVIGGIAKQALQTIKKGLEFNSTLERNEETLNCLAPLVEEMTKFSKYMDRPKGEIERLQSHITQGKELVQKSKKLRRWRFFKFPNYQTKLQKKDEELKRHLSVNVQAENRRDLMEVLTKVTQILELLGQFHGNQIRGLSGAPDEPEECIGMDEPLNRLKIELLKDGVAVLVLTGLGGSGKTTLAKKICRDPQIKGKFGGNIFFVTVSKTPNLKNIVKTLFEHCGCRVPEFQNDEDATNRVGVLLRHVGRNPILLVLDDVWPNSEGLVEKFKFQMSDYKILVTSRVAFRRFGTQCLLDPLAHDRAMSLFRHVAQLDESSPYKPDENLVHEEKGGILLHDMGWFTKLSNGSSDKISHAQYHGKYGDDRIWDNHHSSVDDDLKDIEKKRIDRSIALSLSADDLKRKKVFVEDSRSENEQLCKIDEEENEHLSKAQQEEDERRAKDQLEEYEQLTRAVQESLSIGSSPRHENDSLFQPSPHLFQPEHRICAGCNTVIDHGRFLSCMGGIWHSDCFRCHACHLLITDYEFSMSSYCPYHKSCYREKYHPRCDVCKKFIPANAAGLIEYRVHPFWQQKYCPSHELDGTARCCSCERMEPRDAKYLLLGDGRMLCLECLDSAVMNTHECQPLYLEIQEFYEGLNMKLEQLVQMLLVERQALNEAIEGEKNGHHHLPETRGLCLSEEQTVTTILKRPRIWEGRRAMDKITEPYRLTHRCEVTFILVSYGLPRLLTGSILAHEMMHAWIRLKGYANLSPEVEEGICQVLAHMWLESELFSGSRNNDASSPSSSSSSSLPSSSSASSKKSKRSDFEKKLGEFFKHQIESDTSSVYGDGFRLGNQALLNYGIKRTLDHIQMTGSFP